MYPAHTQLLAKWSSPSIGDRRATGCPPLPTGNVQPTYTARFSKRGSPNICPGLFKDMWSQGLSLFLANRDEGLLL